MVVVALPQELAHFEMPLEKNSPPSDLGRDDDRASESGCPFASLPRPPRVPGRPLVGNTLQLLRNPWSVFQDEFKDYGSAFRVRVLGKNVSVLTGVEVRDLFTRAGDNFLERGFFYEPLRRMMGADELIFQTEGDRHKEVRKMASVPLSRHVAATHVHSVAERLVAEIEQLTPGQWYDALNLSGRSMLASAGSMVADTDLRDLVPDVRWFFAAAMGVAAGTRPRMLRWTPKFRRVRRRTLRAVSKVLHEVRRRRHDDEEPMPPTVVGLLAEANAASDHPMSDDDVVGLLTVCLGGIDFYIGRVVAFMLWAMSTDRELLETARAEVDHAFAEGYDYEGLCSLSLLRGIYLEAMRRYPIWHLVPFRAEQPFEFSGYRLEQDELLLLSSVREHFMDEFYSEPDRFDAARCMAPRDEHRARGAYAPFGRGSRQCVAQGQTEIMALLYCAVLLHRGEFSADERYRLEVRARPLPGPEGFRLRFDGVRQPQVPDGVAMRRDPSVIALLDQISQRLGVEADRTLQAIIDREMRLASFAPGDVILRQGDPSDRFLVIESGRAEVLRADASEDDPRLLATLEPGDVFGETGLLLRTTRNATVRAAHDAPLVALVCDQAEYERLLGTLNVTGEELITLIRGRKLVHVITHLAQELEGRELPDAVQDCEILHVASGEAVVREGDRGDALYVIRAGTFDVVRAPALDAAPNGTSDGSRNGATEPIAQLGPGDIFGEMALLGGVPRTATVRLSGTSPTGSVVRIGARAFELLAGAGGPVRERLFRLSAERTGSAVP